MIELETHEYIGISLIRVIKELAGRVRLLEDTIQQNPSLRQAYESRLDYRAAYEEDEYNRLVEEMQSVLSRLSEIEKAEEM